MELLHDCYEITSQMFIEHLHHFFFLKIIITGVTME